MPRLPATEVQITLEDGKVLHFLKSEGDCISVSQISTYTGTMPPMDIKELDRRYEVQVSHPKTR